MTSSNTISAETPSSQQFGREFQLLVSNKAGQTIDLSQYRVKFHIKRTGYQTPNTADIIVYNVPENVIASIVVQEFSRVFVSAGYAGNYGRIFTGNLKQGISGRESATDTFFNLICGDSDQAYNFSVVTQTIGSASAGGAKQSDQLNAAISSMAQYGVNSGYTGLLPPVVLPRGKVMYGAAKDYIKAISDTNNFDWSIQDEQIILISEKSYLPSQTVVLTAKTGMIGTPQQTVNGMMVKCLLNPAIKMHTLIQINNKSVAQFKIDFTVPGSVANTPPSYSADGTYYVWVAEHIGDTRGTEWYTTISALNYDLTGNPLNGTQPGYGP
jgi:hypothetical protein